METCQQACRIALDRRDEFAGNAHGYGRSIQENAAIASAIEGPRGRYAGCLPATSVLPSWQHRQKLTQIDFRFVAEVLPCWPRSRSKLTFWPSLRPVRPARSTADM